MSEKLSAPHSAPFFCKTAAAADDDDDVGCATSSPEADPAPAEAPPTGPPLRLVVCRGQNGEFSHFAQFCDRSEARVGVAEAARWSRRRRTRGGSDTEHRPTSAPSFRQRESADSLREGGAAQALRMPLLPPDGVALGTQPTTSSATSSVGGPRDRGVSFANGRQPGVGDGGVIGGLDSGAGSFSSSRSRAASWATSRAGGSINSASADIFHLVKDDDDDDDFYGSGGEDGAREVGEEDQEEDMDPIERIALAIGADPAVLLERMRATAQDADPQCRERLMRNARAHCGADSLHGGGAAAHPQRAQASQSRSQSRFSSSTAFSPPCSQPQLVEIDFEDLGHAAAAAAAANFADSSGSSSSGSIAGEARSPSTEMRKPSSSIASTSKSSAILAVESASAQKFAEAEGGERRLTARGTSATASTSGHDSVGGGASSGARLGVSSDHEKTTRKRVGFNAVAVQNVCVYEVDNHLYVAVEFRRYWLAWLLLVLGLLFEVVFQVHFAYFVVRRTPRAGATHALLTYFWESLCLCVWCAIIIVCGHITGTSAMPSSTRFLKSRKGAAQFAAMVVGVSAAIAFIVTTTEVTSSTHFYAMGNLHAAWILLYRVARREHTFAAEVIGVAVTLCGFAISSSPTYSDDWSAPNFRTSFIANALLLGASIAFAAHYLGLQQIRFRVPLTIMLAGPCICSLALSFTLAVSFGTPFGGLDGLGGVFSSTYFLHVALLALEHIAAMAAFYASIRYLDTLSVSVCFTLSTVLTPIGNRLFVYTGPEYELELVREPWGPVFFVGAAIVLAGVVFVSVFSSVKRQFVARRLAIERRRPVPHPYKRSRGATSTSSTLGTHSAARTQ